MLALQVAMVAHWLADLVVQDFVVVPRQLPVREAPLVVEGPQKLTAEAEAEAGMAAALLVAQVMLAAEVVHLIFRDLMGALQVQQDTHSVMDK